MFASGIDILDVVSVNELSSLVDAASITFIYGMARMPDKACPVGLISHSSSPNTNKFSQFMMMRNQARRNTDDMTRGYCSHLPGP